MPEFDVAVRTARVADAAAISAVHRSDVTVWHRYDARGVGVPAPYSDLGRGQRFLNGGPQMDPRDCALHLGRLRRERVPVLVAVERTTGSIVGELELFIGPEPDWAGSRTSMSFRSTPPTRDSGWDGGCS